MTWKDKALAAINPVVAKHRQDCRNGLMDRHKLRQELNKVYPFNQRVNHPYKVWCAMVNEAIEDVFGVEQTEITELPLLNQLSSSILWEDYHKQPQWKD